MGSLERLDDLWRRVRSGLLGGHRGGAQDPAASRILAREAAAMLAHARWMYTSALERSETRGMHKRLDCPELDPGQQRRKLVGGLDEVWTAPDPEWPVTAVELAA
jgi:succinate dehydrogenase/fumarate reductase flavoprotein subunit